MAKKGKKHLLEKRFYNNFCRIFPKLPKPLRQVTFHPTRRWPFDFAWPDEKVAVEIQGGGFMAKSGHNTGVGSALDAEKHRAAVLLGWRLLTFTTYDLKKKRIKKRRGGKKLRSIDKINLMDCVKLVGRFIQRERLKEIIK
jgi:hypothetical protein